MELRQQALQILNVGLSALKPEKILTKKVLEKTGIWDWEEVYVIGAGKGMRFYAEQLEKILGDKIKGGVVSDIEKAQLQKIQVLQASHPLPDKSSLSAALKIIQFIEQVPKNKPVLCLISGGGSSLLTWPTFSVRRLGVLYDLLLKSGADIYEMNILRKHLDRVKGGGLASFISPRPCVSLLISDVPGDDLATIASGPTVYDETTKGQAKEILRKYHLPFKIEGSPVRLLETPKDKKIFQNVKNILLTSNEVALKAMAKEARGLGYQVKIFSSDLKNSSESVGQILFRASKPGLALLAGGETTLTVSGKGKGGRNTHLCLAALEYLPKDTVLLAIDSDGQDNSDAAGAIISEKTLKKAQELNLDPKEYLENFNSYHFFRQTGDLIKTKPLPTNVGDLVVALRH